MRLQNWENSIEQVLKGQKPLKPPPRGAPWETANAWRSARSSPQLGSAMSNHTTSCQDVMNQVEGSSGQGCDSCEQCSQESHPKSC